MSSAEDMNLLTPPAADTPEGARAELVPTPEPPAPAAESQPRETPVEPEPVDAPLPEPKPLLKPNMVAHEIRVTAAFTPTDPNAIDRTLTTEETTSILICETGGVIHLSAAVMPGQLLYLTNVEAKREVVAQVKRKRTFRPTLCYVELGFVEPAPRFWGMDFSAASALLPKNSKDTEAAEAVMAAELTADQPGEPPAHPYEEEVRAFKRDVRSLSSPKPAQSFLETLQPPAASAPGSGAVETPAATPPHSNASPVGIEQNVPAESPSQNDVLTAPTADPSQWAPETQAPQPEVPLDFSLSLPKKRRSLRARGSFTPNFRGGVLRLAFLLVALAFTVAGAAWYKHWLPWQPKLGNSSSGKPTIGLGPNPKVASDAPITSPGVAAQVVATPDAASPAGKETPEASAQPVSPQDSEAEPVVRESPSVSLPEKHPAARPTPKPVSESVSNSGEGVFIPPKLIKSVRAVASLEELRDFETGNVVIDAVVGTSGEVNFISVLSGPPSLRPAAVESLKQYQYEPATRNGQPVPAHVTITIHFRFEP